jgi:hypothetical protein
VLLQKSCIDVAVLLEDGLHRGNPLPPAVRIEVGSGTMIYTEGFGAELVGAEPVFLHVGVTISAGGGKMPATDYAQVFAADEARNEVGAISFVVVADFAALLLCDALHEWRSYIRWIVISSQGW